MIDLNYSNSSALLTKQDIEHNCLKNPNESLIMPNKGEYPLNIFNEIFDKERNLELEEDNEEDINLKRYFMGSEIKPKKYYFNLIKINKNEKDSTNFTNKKTKRGRPKSTDIGVSKGHKGDSLDNLLREIHVHYLSFLVCFINDLLKNLNFKEEYKKLDYQFKRNINKKKIEIFKMQTIGEIISNKESQKYTSIKEFHNYNITQKIKKNEDNKENKGYSILNKILSMKYIDIFKKYYINANKKVDLKKFGMNKTIVLSDKVKMFDKLYNNKKIYNFNIKLCLKKYFIPNLKFIKE